MALRVSAVLLAAGSSKRMGRPKQLLPLGDRPAIRYCCENILAAGVAEITVVIGPQGKEIAEALHGLPVNFATNQDPESEMADSIRIGLHALRDHYTGVLICLSDHALTSPETIRALIERYREDPRKIIFPVYNGKKGHPTLLPKSAAEEIFSVKTLRDIIKKDPGRTRRIDVADEGVILDMDTEEDYQNILKKIGGR
jgi:CTP:molybdopterin cytidylyltransferase MocA